MEINEDIRNIRKNKNLTQKEAADLCGVPLRTYQDYENLEKKKTSLKYEYIMQKLKEYDRYTKEHGVYEISDIKDLVAPIFSKFNINFAILVGNYSFGVPSSTSSIDFIIGENELDSSKLNDLENELKNTLYKNIILIDYIKLLENKDLLLKTLSKGVRIYEWCLFKL